MEFAMVNRETAEKVFITVYNSEGDNLEAYHVAEWTNTTTTANQGLWVELVDTAIGTLAGIAAKVAGVVETTIATDSYGRLQVYGPATVAASASLNVGRMVVASSINATNIGHVEEALVTTTGGVTPAYNAAVVGLMLENGPNATQARVHLSLV